MRVCVCVCVCVCVRVCVCVCVNALTCMRAPRLAGERKPKQAKTMRIAMDTESCGQCVLII